MPNVPFVASFLLPAALLAMASSGGEGAAPTGEQPSVSECKPLPSDQRIVSLTYRPDTPLVDVVAAYAGMTCKRLEVVGKVSQHLVTFTEKEPISTARLGSLIRAAAHKARLHYREDRTSIHVRGS